MSEEYRFAFKVMGEPIPAPRPRTVTKGGKTWTYSGNKPYRDWLKQIVKDCPETHRFDDCQLKVYFLTEKKIDLDNALKGVMDALQGKLYDNDKVVWNVSVCRLLPSNEGACTHIEVIGEGPEHCQAKLLSEVVE